MRMPTFLALFMAMTWQVFAAADLFPDFGPENNGLRLKLEIKSADAPQDEHTIKLTIKNVGNGERTFTTKIRHQGKDTFADFVQQCTSFQTYPYVLQTGYSIGGAGRTSPQLSQSLKAGIDWSTVWTVKGRTLSAYHKQTDVHFPTTGRFDLKAQLTLYEGASTFLLWSNTAAIFIGGNQRAPKGCAGQIQWNDEERGAIILGCIGTHYANKVGDRFQITYGKSGHFDLEITAVEDERCTVKVVRKEIWNEVPHIKFLQRGDWAGLVPEDTGNH